jgi:glycine cleavage system H protein
MKKYSRTHEWVEIIDGIAYVGITDYAQKELGDIVYIELPKTGIQVKEGESTAVLESTKAASDFYSPISGMIIEVNKALSDDSGLLNRSPEKEGWIYKMSKIDAQQLDKLLNVDDYLTLIK